MDYKDLIATLRSCSNKKGHRCSECPAFGKGDYHCAKTAMKKAAAALTTLTAQLEELQAKYDHLNQFDKSQSYKLLAKNAQLRAELEKEKEYTAFYQGLVDKYEKEIVPRFWKLMHKAEGGVST